MIRSDDLEITQRRPPEDVIAEEGTLLLTTGVRLFWRGWRSSERAEDRGLIVMHHGFSEHSHRYTHVASALVRLGYKVFAADAPGHGRSEGKRGHIDRWEEYLVAFDEVIRFASERFKTESVGVLGHSNGGLIVLRHALAHPLSSSPVRAYVVSSPFCGFGFPLPKVQLAAVKGLSKLLPRLPIPIGLPADKTSHIASVVEEYLSDPLVFDKTTPRWVCETIQAQEELMSRAVEIEHPILFLISGADEIVDPKAAETVYHALSSTDREFHLLPELYHENLNEEGWFERVERISSWFDRFM